MDLFLAMTGAQTFWKAHGLSDVNRLLLLSQRYEVWLDGDSNQLPICTVYKNRISHYISTHSLLPHHNTAKNIACIFFFDGPCVLKEKIE
jgi:hypothetical protein